MTLEALKDTIRKRRHAIGKVRGHEAIGLVISQNYYDILLTDNIDGWGVSIIKSCQRVYNTGHPKPGDAYLGLDVAITKAEDYIVVY